MPAREKETRGETASSAQLGTLNPDIFSQTTASTQSSTAEDLSEGGPQLLHSAPLMRKSLWLVEDPCVLWRSNSALPRLFSELNKVSQVSCSSLRKIYWGLTQPSKERQRCKSCYKPQFYLLGKGTVRTVPSSKNTWAVNETHGSGSPQQGRYYTWLK